MSYNYAGNEVSIKSKGERTYVEKTSTALVLQTLLCTADLNWDVWVYMLVEVTFRTDKNRMLCTAG